MSFSIWKNFAITCDYHNLYESIPFMYRLYIGTIYTQFRTNVLPRRGLSNNIDDGISSEHGVSVG